VVVIWGGNMQGPQAAEVRRAESGWDSWGGHQAVGEEAARLSEPLPISYRGPGGGL